MFFSSSSPGDPGFLPFTLCLLHEFQFPGHLLFPFSLEDLAECSLILTVFRVPGIQSPSHLPRPRRVQSSLEASRKVAGFMEGFMMFGCVTLHSQVPSCSYRKLRGVGLDLTHC